VRIRREDAETGDLMINVDLLNLPHILRSHRRMVVLWVLALPAIVALTYMLLPDRYRATASVVIDNRRMNHVLSEGHVLPGAPMVATQSAGTLVATQFNIVGSERVARQVVTDMNLTNDAEFRRKWLDKTNGEINAHSWIADRLLRNLVVTRASPESAVLHIIYTDENPEKAAAIANSFANAYLTVMLGLSVSPTRLSARFFEDRVKSTRDHLNTARTALAAYERDNGIVNSDERLDIETAQLNELTSALTAARSRRIDTRARRDQVAGNPTSSPEVLQNSVVQGLTAEVARGEARLKELSHNLGPNHPVYRANEMQVAELRTKLSEASRRAALSASNVERAGAQSEGDLVTAMKAQRGRVLELKHIRNELTVLQRDVDSAQRTYDLALQRLSQSTQESESLQNDASLLTPASVPFESSYPRPYLTLPLAAIVGLLAGILVALVLEYRLPRIYGARDLAAAFGLPILADIPGRRRHSRRLLPSMLARISKASR
jgi:succinoglycan biosynthesis transport protein ExoP